MEQIENLEVSVKVELPESAEVQPTENNAELSNSIQTNGVMSNGLNGDAQAQPELHPEVLQKLKDLVKIDKLKEENLTELSPDLIELPLNAAMSILGKFESKKDVDKDRVNALRSIIKTYSPKYTIQADTTPRGPDTEKMAEIIQRLGLQTHLTSGQRKYELSDESYPEPSPHAGCEILVRNIPQSIFEDDLIPIFETQGKIWRFRLMIDSKTRFNKGFGFVLFTTKEEADQAVAKLDKYELSKGRELRVSILVPKLRLFVGSIPKYKTKEEIQQALSQIMSGITDVIIQGNGDINHKNRGYCFLEFDNHASANNVLKKHDRERYYAWNRELVMDWAKPQKECDEESMSKVKELFVKDVPSDIDEDKLKEMFESYGLVKQVRKIKDYAFIHYKERESALKAIDDYKNNKPDTAITVSLAKPIDKKKESERKRDKRILQPMNNFYNPVPQFSMYYPYTNQPWGAPGYGNHTSFYGNRLPNENLAYNGHQATFNPNFNYQPQMYSQMQYRGANPNENHRGGYGGKKGSYKYNKKDQSNNNVVPKPTSEGDAATIPSSNKEQTPENSNNANQEVNGNKSS